MLVFCMIIGLIMISSTKTSSDSSVSYLISESLWFICGVILVIVPIYITFIK